MNNSALRDAPVSVSPYAPVTALAFTAGSDLERPLSYAMRFAGDGGRVATIRDILEARLKCGSVDEPAWQTWFTTTTSEYFGRSPWGVPVIVVAHGNGPLSDVDVLLSTYAEARGRRTTGGRITQEVFNKLLDGEFGKVDVVDARSLASKYQYPFASRTAEELLEHPLWVARLGGLDLAQRYLGRHAMAALGKREKWAPSAKRLHPGRLVSMGEPDSPYLMLRHPLGATTMDANLPDEGFATAHLLSIGRMARCGNFDGYVDSYQCDIGVHDAGDGVRFLGIRRDADLTALHPGMLGGADLEDSDDRHFWISAAPQKPPALYTLMSAGERWFTMYPKDHDGLDTCEAQHAVVGIETVGEVGMLTTSVGGYHGFFKYHLDEVVALAPEGANAYAFCGRHTTDGTISSRRLRFYKVQVDASRYLPSPDQVQNDFDLQMKVLGIA